MGIFELVDNSCEQVVVKVNAKDALTVAMHPYVTAQMEYITVTKGEDHTYTIVYNNGHTWSFECGLHGYTIVSENTKRLMSVLDSFLYEHHVFLDVKTTELPCGAEFYISHILDCPSSWWVNLLFENTRKTARVYVDIDEYPTAESVVHYALAEYNPDFERAELTKEPNFNVGTVYKAFI